MQFKFASLETTPFPELVDAFNKSFAGYFVRIELTENSLTEKIASENIKLEHSVGAFVDNRLAGFILTGIEGAESYNAGTGVLPEYRGNNLTAKMYEFVLPKLRSVGIYSQVLEVITQNEPAIKTYERVGFKKIKTLSCFKGSLTKSVINPNVKLKMLEHINTDVAMQFWNSHPSWQNSLQTIQRSKTILKITGAFIDSDLAGYLIFTPEGRVKQFGVRKDLRRQAIAQTLFAHANTELANKEIIVTNIDSCDHETTSFLEKIGLTNFLEQFEMEMSF